MIIGLIISTICFVIFKWNGPIIIFMVTIYNMFIVLLDSVLMLAMLIFGTTFYNTYYYNDRPDWLNKLDNDGPCLTNIWMSSFLLLHMFGWIFVHPCPSKPNYYDIRCPKIEWSINNMLKNENSKHHFEISQRYEELISKGSN